jgi:hypothetical protein
VGRLQIAVLLQLVSVKTIADTAQISDSKAISALDLKPHLAPFNGGVCRPVLNSRKLEAWRPGWT